ncbi:uncharacterized protein LOC134220698 [Armigeres subalbatus]|uniref:uncharacterized protein LOC134220698 n=1 Tax=Armigeres subalbatus TaxID=124917 RepID=UPI002ED0FC1A
MKFQLFVFVAAQLAFTSHALDLFTITQINYAIIQSGLSQLGEATRQFNCTISEQEQRAVAALDGVNKFIEQTFYGLTYQYPQHSMVLSQMNLSLDTDQISKVSSYKSVVTDFANKSKNSFVRLTMTASNWIMQLHSYTMAQIAALPKNCSDQYALQFIGPLASFDRMQHCSGSVGPHFEATVNTTIRMLNFGRNMAADIFRFMDLCSPNSTACVRKVLNRNSLLLDAFQYMPQMYTMPWKDTWFDCVSLIYVDIQNTLSNLFSSEHTC